MRVSERERERVCVCVLMRVIERGKSALLNMWGESFVGVARVRPQTGYGTSCCGRGPRWGWGRVLWAPALNWKHFQKGSVASFALVHVHAT